MSFFANLLASRGAASTESADINFDVNMVEVEEGTRAVVLYNRERTRERTPDGSNVDVGSNQKYDGPSTPSKRHDRSTDKNQPFTPSKRQYREVDESISLREKNRTLMATNEALVEQQAVLAQNAEHASQMARQAEIQHKEELKAMQLAQEKFQQELMQKFQLELAKMQVSYIARCSLLGLKGIQANKENEMAAMIRRYDEKVNVGSSL